MPAVATTATASARAETATGTVGARAGDANAGGFARLLETAQGAAETQPSAGPATVANPSRKATPNPNQKAAPNPSQKAAPDPNQNGATNPDQKAAANPNQNAAASANQKAALDQPSSLEDGMPPSRRTSGPVENGAAGELNLPGAPGQKAPPGAAGQTAEQQTAAQPGSGQGQAGPVPLPASTVTLSVVPTQPATGLAQGKTPVPLASSGRSAGAINDRQQAQSPRPAAPDAAAHSAAEVTQDQGASAATSLGACVPSEPGATVPAGAALDPAAPDPAVPATAAPGPNATALSDPRTVAQSVMDNAASSSLATAAPPVPSGGPLVTAGQSEAAKADDAASPIPTFAGAAGVTLPTSPATNTATVLPGPTLPRVAGEAGEPVAMRIARAARDGDETVTLELHPAELGRVEVRLSFHADGVGVQMTLDRPETFEAFSRNRAGLEQQLAQSGIDLGGGGLDLRLGQQGGQPDSERRSANFRAPTSFYAISPTTLPPVTSWAGQGLVDIVA